MKRAVVAISGEVTSLVERGTRRMLWKLAEAGFSVCLHRSAWGDRLLFIAVVS